MHANVVGPGSISFPVTEMHRARAAGSHQEHIHQENIADSRSGCRDVGITLRKVRYNIPLVYRVNKYVNGQYNNQLMNMLTIIW